MTYYRQTVILFSKNGLQPWRTRMYATRRAFSGGCGASRPVCPTGRFGPKAQMCSFFREGSTPGATYTFEPFVIRALREPNQSRVISTIGIVRDVRLR